MTHRGFSAIGLHHPKTPANVGGAMRAADCYGAKLIAKTGRRYEKAPTDTTNASARIPLIHCDDFREIIPFGCVPVAVDLIAGAKPLFDFYHPESAFYIFGPEDGTLGSSILSWCVHTIYVPTQGCMNLAATVNVVLYDRMAKAEQRRRYGAQSRSRNDLANS